MVLCFRAFVLRSGATLFAVWFSFSVADHAEVGHASQYKRVLPGLIRRTNRYPKLLVTHSGDSAGSRKREVETQHSLGLLAPKMGAPRSGATTVASAGLGGRPNEADLVIMTRIVPMEGMRDFRRGILVMWLPCSTTRCNHCQRIDRDPVRRVTTRAIT